MKWKKLGKIFNPEDYKLSDGYSLFAKSPQALVFDDFVRIYFCAQKKTENGKYVSLPHFVDFDKNLEKVIKVSSRPVIKLGSIGQFDEHGIFPMNVLKCEDRILAYTTGWSRRVSVSIDMEIGFAESFDSGETFLKPGLGGPIMSPNVNEPFMIGDGFVRQYEGRYHMWYIFGGKWGFLSKGEEPDRNYRIAYAHSQDGLSWEREGRYIIEAKTETECQALPTVFNLGGKHHMLFCYRDMFDFRNNREKSYRLGYAYSFDGIKWVRKDDDLGIDVTPDSWDSDMMCYPNVFESDGKFYLLYNGNEFGKYGFGAAILTGF
jgi:hypothetical protein